MRGLILSGGRGYGLKPMTYVEAKQLLPVANRPIIFYGLDALVAAGIDEIGVVVDGKKGFEIERTVGNEYPQSSKITFIKQAEPLGLAHAISIARDFLEDKPFLMHLGDNLIEEPLSNLVASFEKSRACALVSLKELSNPGDFGVAELDRKGNLVALEEKPAKPKSKFALAGVYLFNHEIHQAVDQLKPSKRGQFEITEAIQWLIDKGKKVETQFLEGWWLDTGKKDSLLEANRLILDRQGRSLVAGTLLGKSRVTGRVEIGEGTVLIDSTVRGPAIIGKNCRLEHAYVGPSTAIGDNCVISHAEVQHSIVCQRCRIVDLEGRIEESLLGVGVEICKGTRLPTGYKFMIGDDSVVEIA